MMDYLAEYGKMTDEDLRELLNIKKTRAYMLSLQMNENWLIEIIGRDVGKRVRDDVWHVTALITTQLKHCFQPPKKNLRM